MKKRELYAGCPVQHALGFIGGKWQIGILWQMKKGPVRFGHLQENLPGISEKILSQNLRFFESAGVIAKTVFVCSPPRTEYMLTEEGRTLLPVLEKIIHWGYRHMQEQKVNSSMSGTPWTAIDGIEASLDS